MADANIQDSFCTDESSIFCDEEEMFHSPDRRQVIQDNLFLSPKKGHTLDSPIRASPSPRRERSMKNRKESPRQVMKESPRAKLRERYGPSDIDLRNIKTVSSLDGASSPDHRLSSLDKNDMFIVGEE